MEFTEVEIELSNGLVAYVSGEFEPHYEDNRYDDEFGTVDPGSGWIADEIEIKKITLWIDEKELYGSDAWRFADYIEVIRELENYLDKLLNEYEP